MAGTIKKKFASGTNRRGRPWNTYEKPYRRDGEQNEYMLIKDSRFEMSLHHLLLAALQEAAVVGVQAGEVVARGKIWN